MEDAFTPANRSSAGGRQRNSTTAATNTSTTSPTTTTASPTAAVETVGAGGGSRGSRHKSHQLHQHHHQRPLPEICRTSNYGKSLLAGIEDLFKQRSLCDFTIRVSANPQSVVESSTTTASAPSSEDVVQDLAQSSVVDLQRLAVDDTPMDTNASSASSASFCGGQKQHYQHHQLQQQSGFPSSSSSCSSSPPPPPVIEFPVHKVVVAACSDYFRALFR